ncbi:hypothetical protein [Variovorax sp. EBFNA2]|uniref:hypothetical protein n=1 Tax=Variovorax sp. EBFNA2 TaxID=3342097 RepID=UPI0029C0E41A|nr:hypothetical protein [Variovorax boronicumulans]WPG35127.1 hypothetical protein RZE79_16680 [Variovorax boronicumulans]
MNVNDYLGRQYENPPCWRLVADVYANERGEGVSEFRTINNTVRQIAATFRLALFKGEHGFQQVEVPSNYTVVLLSRFPKLGWHHCGVFYEGKVLHGKADGNLYQDMASLGDTYPQMQFWGRP